jgi:hypothetical protein
MTPLLVLATLGQLSYSDEVARPVAVQLSAEMAESFPARPVPRVFRVASETKGETYHLALDDPPPGAVHVIPPSPESPKRAGPYEPDPYADQRRINDLEVQVASLKKRIADLERTRAATPPHVAVSCPHGCPECDKACSFPGECGHPGCGGACCKLPAARPVARQWFNLTNEPGTQGYGSLNALGQVVVEQRRPLAAKVVPTYQSAMLDSSPYAPLYIRSYGSPYQAAGSGSVCGPGGCSAGIAAPRGGFFGRLLGR